MDYEKKYNEALKAVESLYNVVRYLSSNDALLTFQTLEKAFPELKESEDEKIRREMIDFLAFLTNLRKDRILYTDDFNFEQFKIWIAWLEKQGDVNTSNFEEAEKEKDDFEKAFPELRESEDERIRKGLIKGLSAMRDIYKHQTFSDDAINIDDAIAWLEKQCENNHAYNEDDERIRKALLEYFGEQCDMSNWNGIYGYEVYDWLKKQGEQKHSWSEEDEQMIETICKNGNLKPSEQHWLKSLKPCWKPTIEQMQALKYEIESTNENSWQRRACEKLYEDLKTL